MSDRICCPSCGFSKGREDACPHCRCPGETERLREIAAGKSRRQETKEEHRVAFRLGQEVTFNYPHGVEAKGVVVGLNRRLKCVKVKWTRNSGPGDWIPVQYLK